jgi:hypothetical protein
MKGCPIGTLVFTDKLVTAVLAPVILLAAAFFPVSGYAGAVAMGALDFFGF